MSVVGLTLMSDTVDLNCGVRRVAELRRHLAGLPRGNPLSSYSSSAHTATSFCEARWRSLEQWLQTASKPKAGKTDVFPKHQTSTLNGHSSADAIVQYTSPAAAAAQSEAQSGKVSSCLSHCPCDYCDYARRFLPSSWTTSRDVSSSLPAYARAPAEWHMSPSRPASSALRRACEPFLEARKAV